MRLITKVLVVAAIAAAIAAPLFAQEEKTLQERNVYLFMPDGRMISMAVDDPKQAMIMRNFNPASTAMLAYASAGKLYITEDRKMESGKMLSAEIFGKDFSIQSQH